MKHHTEEAKCENCQYWYPFKIDEHLTGEGQCRRNAPRIISQEPPYPSYALWPITKKDDWCGEVELKKIMFTSRPPRLPQPNPDAMNPRG